MKLHTETFMNEAPPIENGYNRISQQAYALASSNSILIARHDYLFFWNKVGQPHNYSYGETSSLTTSLIARFQDFTARAFTTLFSLTSVTFCKAPAPWHYMPSTAKLLGKLRLLKKRSYWNKCTNIWWLGMSQFYLPQPCSLFGIVGFLK